MGGISSGLMQRFVDYLNAGCDDISDDFIDKTFYKLNVLSGIYPVLNRDKPLLSIMKLLPVLANSLTLLFFWYVLFVSSMELSRINFVLFMNQIHVMILAQMSVAVLWHSWLMRPTKATLYRILGEDFFDYQEDLSEISDTLRVDLRKQKRRSLQCIILIGVATATTVLVTPNLNKIGTFHFNSTLYTVNFDLPVPSANPFNPNDPVSFYFAYFSEIYCATILCLELSTKCFMFIECSLAIKLHLKLLIFQFKNIEMRALKLFSDRYVIRPTPYGRFLYIDKKFTECFNICLNRNIEHHQVIVRAMGHLNKVFGFYAFNFYLTATATIAMGVLSTSSTAEFPGTTIGAAVMCLVEVLFVALYSHLGQRLTDLAIDLRNEIYNIRWYHGNKQMKSVIAILQAVTTQPLGFSYFNIIHINYDSFATVLNSAYTYYNLVSAYR